MSTSIKQASLITAGSKYLNIFLGILFSAVLSRILTPNDYGIAAIVTIFSAFFSVLSNCGLGIAVIQNKDFTQDD
ncbi:MAG: oligosaccharide flippase family protein, partial [Treponemataceae bacterium]|nr:oligosaccharide flippase family protein [Treponemataceae bacterium]